MWDQNACILKQGEKSDRFLIISWGRLKACYETRDGRCLILGLYGQGEVVGLASALVGRAHRTTVQTMTQSGCLMVDRDRLFNLFSGQPRLIGELLPSLAQNLVGCKNCLVEVAGCPVEVRLACLFLRLLGQHPNTSEGRIPVRLSRQELAELTGTTVETACRVMSRWRRQGIVSTSDDGFRVRQPDELREIVLQER